MYLAQSLEMILTRSKWVERTGTTLNFGSRRTAITKRTEGLETISQNSPDETVALKNKIP
jgi:hypothetical protein